MAVKDAIGQIINLKENGSIIVVDNLKLSNLLQTLADSLITSIRHDTFNIPYISTVTSN